jgi:hypothetical protein
MNGTGPKSGDKMADGTLYVEISPHAQQPMFTTPEDLDALVDITQAEEVVQQLNAAKAYGHNDWRLPDDREKKILLSVQSEGCLKDGFNRYMRERMMPERSDSSCYLSSDDLSKLDGRRHGGLKNIVELENRDGTRYLEHQYSDVKFFIRPVRTGPV